MNYEFQQAVALLMDLLALKKASLDSADRTRVDAVVDQVLEEAYKDAERLTVDWIKEREAHAERVIVAEEQARLAVIEEEEREAKALVQDALDQAERQERSIAGVS